MICSNEQSMCVEQFAMAGMECYEILDQISKNEKGGHSDMSQGNPKGCSLERQVGCVHSDKHARSPCWRKFHPRIWPGYQTSFGRRLYNAYMGFMDKSDRTVNSYGIARIIWTWTKKLFFQLTDMTILNAFLIHKSCGGKMTHRNLSPTAYQLSRLEVKNSQHWPAKGKQQRCRVCSLHKQTRSTLYICRKCDDGLCIVNCFEKWHTRVNLSH